MIQIGVDIGGTFTDVVCRQAGKPDRVMKLPTTRDDPSRAVIASIARMAGEWDVAPQAIARFVHGTTVATNAVIERRGPKVGLLTTAGFKDVLEIGRQMRQQMYRVVLRPETPVFLAPSAMRKEVSERVAADGSVVAPLEEQSVCTAAAELVSHGVEAIAICFLHAYLNPSHEQRAAEIVRRAHPDLHVSLSCEVDPAFREYERTVVTAFDAYIKPVIERYLAKLEAGLRQVGVTAPLQVMQSRGGVAAAAAARTRPVRMFLSGPAAGVIGARTVGRAIGIDDLISVDIGGTSCDIALIHAGKPLIRAEGLVDRYPIRVPMVDVNAIGAGGGSIAWIDSAGGLRVGPHSAGSDPGPACYGTGGEDATVTDGSVVLGYIDPGYFAGGSLKLEPARAWQVIEQRIARPLRLPVEQSALGIHRVVNAQMTEGIRLVSIRQGFDPRKFTLLALGGAGGLHATALADELGITRVVIPRYPGVLSAAGLLAADVEHEVSAAFPRALASLAFGDVEPVLRDLDARCADLMVHERVDASAVERSYFADVCYVGQSHTLEVPIEVQGPEPIGRLYAEFIAAHDRVFGHSTHSPARVVNLRAVHRARQAAPAVLARHKASGAAGRKVPRKILLPGSEQPVAVEVYERDMIGPDTTLVGPAIIEQVDTTTLVGRGWQARLLEEGNILLTREQPK
jgi:N-methylhydantoinase A